MSAKSEIAAIPLAIILLGGVLEVSEAEKEQAIHIVDPKDPLRANIDLEDLAARELTMAFGGIASHVLASNTDTRDIAWHDLENAVCRTHQDKPSLVLPRPYFEDVEYRARLESAGSANPNFRQLRLLVDASISVAINPSKSGYHPPKTEKETTPYKELLVKLAAEIRIGLEKNAKEGGWHVTERGFDTFDIDGLSK